MTVSKRKSMNCSRISFRVRHRGRRGRGARNRNQTRQVDGKIILERGVFEQVGHGQVGIGILLKLQHDLDVGGGFVADVDQLRHFSGGDEFADTFDNRGFVHGKGYRGDDDLGFAGRGWDHGELPAQANQSLAGLINLTKFGPGIQNFPPVGKSGPLIDFMRSAIVQVRSSIRATAPLMTSSRLCGGMFVAMPTAMPVDPLTNRLETARQDQRLFIFAVVIGLEVNGVLVQFVQQFDGDGVSLASV